MRKTQQIIESFDTFDEAFISIQNIRRTGCDINNMSIIGRDRKSDSSDEINGSRGDMIAIGSFELPLGIHSTHLMRTAVFYCEDVGSVFVAGPLTDWALQIFTRGEPQAGLAALGSRLYSMGTPGEDILLCQEAVRQGRVLLVIPGLSAPRHHANDRAARVIRISDMKNYG